MRGPGIAWDRARESYLEPRQRRLHGGREPVPLADAFRAAFPNAASGFKPLDVVLRWPLALAGLHLFLMAVFEATAILLSTGETTAIIYFGIALLLYGLVTQRRTLSVLGLVLVFLKPQIGVAYAAVHVFLGKEERLQLVPAVAVSALLSVPALIADPGIIGVFLKNAAVHDLIMAADLSGAMTGVRHLSGRFGFPISTIVSIGVATAACVLLTTGPLRCNRSPNTAVRAWQTVSLTTAALVALAPLHYYDFVIAGPLVFAVAAAPLLPRLIGAAGWLLMLRAQQLGTATGLYDKDLDCCEGSFLATVGGFCILASVIGAALRWGKSKNS